MKTLNAALLLIAFASMVAADGMIHVYDHDQWYLQPENQQTAAIHYENGYQNMLVTVDLQQDTPGERAIWIFPIPATPDKVHVDIMKGFPQLYGRELDRDFRDSTLQVSVLSVVLATFPANLALLPFLFFGIGGVATSSGPMPMAIGGLAATEKGTVTVHEWTAASGLATQLISATDMDALDGYFREKGVTLPSQSREVLTQYLAKDYSFVVSYIVNLQQFREETARINPPMLGGLDGEVVAVPGRYPSPTYYKPMPVGVFVRFKTDRLYFPLKPSGVYGSRRIPVTLYVTGHVNPRIYEQLSPTTEVRYMVGGSSSDRQLAEFFNYKEATDLKYTKITFTSASNLFTEDLWMDRGAPASVAVKDAWMDNLLLAAVVLFLLLMTVPSVIAGRLAFKDPQVPMGRLALNGLASIFSMFGFAIATYFMDVGGDRKARRGKGARQGTGAKVAYAVLYYVMMIVLAVLVVIIAQGL